jgi:putative ABC transport system permease protein
LFGNTIYVLGKVKRNVSLANANDDLRRIADRISIENPRYSPYSIEAVSIQAESFRDNKATASAMISSLLLILLIGFANIVQLVMARVSRRNRETAVRLALGASRSAPFRVSHQPKRRLYYL